MSECDIDEIMKQLKVLDSLKQLRDNMGNNFFLETFPELTGLNGKLDVVIEKQETELQNKMSECGNLNVDELPQDAIPELEPEMESIPEL